VKKMHVALSFVMLALLFFGCQPGESPGPTITTIDWQADGAGFIQFQTNDTANLGYGQYANYSSSAQNAPTVYPGGTVTAVIKKISGSAGAGMGIIFCYQDTSNFYRLLISEDGWYNIYKKVGGTYTSIQSWTQSSSISQGYGVSNTLSVTQSAANNYSVYINNMTTPEITFVDSSVPNAGEAGFYASISSTTEDFPSIPEDIRFKLIEPVSIP
jgi:hypothetical protein